jgi:hypothetical protein
MTDSDSSGSPITFEDLPALVARYRAGYAEVEAVIRGATDEQLDSRPAPGEWSAREVVHHLADSETMATTRLRRLLTEADPEIQGYDEARFAEVLHYDRPIAGSLALLRAVRDASAELLDLLTEADLERTGTHSESGPYGVRIWLETYLAHTSDHADQIRGALAPSP